jgi:transcriptional regulator with XRE-family HTH domain
MKRRKKSRADLKAIGCRIRELRGDVLQEELAEFLGISQGQLSKIERGNLGPTPEIMVRLVERFGKTADWILIGKS